MKFILLAAALFFSFGLPSAQAGSEEEINNYLRQTILPNFSVQNAPAADALAQLQQQANLNQNQIFYYITAKDTVKKSFITLNLQNVPAYDVLVAICASMNVKFAVKRDQIRIFDTGNASGL